MNSIHHITIAATVTCLLLASTTVQANDTPEGSQSKTSETVVDKVEKKVTHAAKATGKGIEHAAEATARGVKRGAKAVAKGVEHGANAVGRTAERVAEKISPSQPPAPVVDKAKAD